MRSTVTTEGEESIPPPPRSLVAKAARTACSATHAGQRGRPGAAQRREGRKSRGSRASLTHKPEDTRRNRPVAPLKWILDPLPRIVWQVFEYQYADVIPRRCKIWLNCGMWLEWSLYHTFYCSFCWFLFPFCVSLSFLA